MNTVVVNEVLLENRYPNQGGDEMIMFRHSIMYIQPIIEAYLRAFYTGQHGLRDLKTEYDSIVESNKSKKWACPNKATLTLMNEIANVYDRHLATLTASTRPPVNPLYDPAAAAATCGGKK